ncbi:hypothetical protein LH412_17365 [Yersinia intermedia]|uniref:hypothetical protein n=1 Tax=Yersinia intermedia TaxID=631 RepID=UPI001CFECBAE|nr:hypothetical protein [Yersinia intermedia]MCB5323773.1 hypothetical protein [Yersinia intermedia]
MKNNRQCVRHRISRYSLGLCLLALMGQPAVADTITIGKGSGIVWEGLPFSTTMSGPIVQETAAPSLGLLAIVDTKTWCQPTTRLTTIAGYAVKKLTTGVGLIPRATGHASYYLKDNTPASLSGTLGLPETKGVVSNGDQVSSPDYAWCLSPTMSIKYSYYNGTADRTATVSGNWVLVADGTQTSNEISMPEMFATTSSDVASGRFYSSILPANTKLRISTLECTVNTPLLIEFGNVPANNEVGAELAVQSYSLITTCGQTSNYINANINLQFRALTGLYGSTPGRLALSQGGGYITGEINNGVTGSGSCTATTGLPFDNTQLKVGSISSTQTSQTITNQVTWRLCSGGSSLPTGAVSAAAEMLVTFN